MLRKVSQYYGCSGYPSPSVFAINTYRLSRCMRYGLTHFADHLLGGFIHVYHWIVGIIRHVINLQDIFHMGYKSCAPCGRDFPVLVEMRLKFIFFKTRCTVMWETVSANLSSTALSASNLTVHRRCPDGASEHARAINLASNAPSKMTSRGGLAIGLRSSAASRPSSTNRFLRCSIDRHVTPRASDTSDTFHAGPSSPASHNSLTLNVC